jgi:cell wall-associated NlpC family hydrolase
MKRASPALASGLVLSAVLLFACAAPLPSAPATATDPLLPPPDAGAGPQQTPATTAVGSTPDDRSQAVIPQPLASAAALAMVEHARETVGTPYRLGGRCRRPADGIDCQGVLFYAAERVGSCDWRSWSVLPTKTVADRELGEPVPGMDPVASEALEIDRLAPGDVLFLVDAAENPAEPAIGKLGETPVWVWHTGLYSGDGRWIVGDHYAGRAVETDLATYLDEHGHVYGGVYVLRLTGPPTPSRCREGARLVCPDG